MVKEYPARDGMMLASIRTGLMTQQIQRKEPGTESVRRIVRHEAKKAIEHLSPRGQPKDVAVHDARKGIKRARAALRLVRKPLGEKRYHRENEELRDAAQPLSAVRDAKILVEAFDRLVGSSPRRAVPGLDRVRDLLVRHQLRARRQLLGRKKALEPTRSALRSVRRRASRWPLEQRSWPSLGAGVDRVYRAGRKQLAIARRRPSDMNLHELRKQAKYLWQQLEILEPIAPRTIRPLVRHAHALSDRLGEDHDLAVLRERLSRSSAHAPRAARRALADLIGEAREKLQTRGLAEGEKVYAEKPGRLSRRLEERWRTWRRKRSRDSRVR
jgi:CHAD domain-containing protein